MPVRAEELEDEREMAATSDKATLRVYRRLKDVARQQGSITYGDLNRDCELGLDLSMPHDRDVIGVLAGEVSSFEVAKGRPMLSAVLVHTGPVREPGRGFYTLAAKLGRFKTGETDKQVWYREINESHVYWSQRR